MAERVTLFCDFCNTSNPRSATKRLLVRVLDGSTVEGNIDVCTQHLKTLGTAMSRNSKQPISWENGSTKMKQAAGTPHKRSQHGGATYGNYACDHCDKKFNTAQGQAMHLWRVHPTPKQLKQIREKLEAKKAS